MRQSWLVHMAISTIKGSSNWPIYIFCMHNLFILLNQEINVDLIAVSNARLYDIRTQTFLIVYNQLEPTLIVDSAILWNITNLRREDTVRNKMSIFIDNRYLFLWYHWSELISNYQYYTLQYGHLIHHHINHNFSQNS